SAWCRKKVHTTDIFEPLQASVVLLSEDQPLKSTDSAIQIKEEQHYTDFLKQESPKSEIL
ncbi:hypothetical protein MKX01_020142, partial [Papaver californicum]